MKIILGILYLPFTLLFFLLLSVTWTIMWAWGVPIAVRRGGRVVGEIRWFRYTKVDNKYRV